MIKEFIPHQQASQLKELGFDEPCLAFYWNTGKFYTTAEYPHSIETHKQNQLGDYNPDSTSAPLYQQAFKFFREKYDLRIWIESNYGILKFEYVIATTNSNFIDKQLNDFSSFKTYEETELECLKKLIEIVNDK
jgi:hypothetical protein